MPDQDPDQRELSAENAAELFGKSKSEPEQEPDRAAESSGLPPGLGPVDLEAEQEADKSELPDEERKRIEARADALLAALAAERQRQALAGASPQERRLVEDVARFQAEGNTVAASIAANELKQIRRVPPWLR